MQDAQTRPAEPRTLSTLRLLCWHPYIGLLPVLPLYLLPAQSAKPVLQCSWLPTLSQAYAGQPRSAGAPTTLLLLTWAHPHAGPAPCEQICTARSSSREERRLAWDV